MQLHLPGFGLRITAVSQTALLVLLLWPPPVLAQGRTLAFPSSPAPRGPTADAATPASSPQSAATIDLDQAINLALSHNHSLLATRTQLDQSKAQETTAALRPNPSLGVNTIFLPFTPSEFNTDFLNNNSEFDVALGYTFERGHKRQRRIEAARDATSITAAQIADAERALTFNVAQQFINTLLAKSNVEFARAAYDSFHQTVSIAQEQYRAGAISENDFLKIRLQELQFRSDISNAALALSQSKVALRQLIGFDTLAADFDTVGDLSFKPLTGSLADLQARAIATRPDLLASQRGVTAAKSQFELARANARRDLGTTFQYSHTAAFNTGGLLFNIDIPIFDRNQGEIARTRFAITQSEQQAAAAKEVVLGDVTNAFDSATANADIVKMYEGGALNDAKQSRDISQYAYQRGAASLLDYLDAERNYRTTELAYRQALANYQLAVEQLREAVGARELP